MSYSYYASAAPTRSLETLLEDVDPCSDSNVYRTADTTAANDVHQSASAKFLDSFSDSAVQSFPALHVNRAARTGTIIGVVQLILPPHTFKQRNGRPGFVQSIIVVDFHAQRLNADVWRYKIVLWNEQAKNLSVELNCTYRFNHFKLKPVKGNCEYPGQDEYEVHLTSISTITEVLP